MKLKKTQNKYHMPSIYFGFLSGLGIFTAFILTKFILGIIPFPSKIYPEVLALIIIYLFNLKFSYNYAKYMDKDLRKSLLYSSMGFLIIYYILILI